MSASSYRKTTQYLMPAHHSVKAGEYNIYPAFTLDSGSIHLGFANLAAEVAKHSCVVIDGFAGVMWQDFRERLGAELEALGLKISWTDVTQALKKPETLEPYLAPFLGGDDPVFGMCFTGELKDFFDLETLQKLRPNPEADLNILYGCGAALAGWNGWLIYLDLPKNELQFRARAGVLTNLGVDEPLPPKVAYKRSYFVDWPALRQHQADLLLRLDLIVDTQRAEEPSSMSGESLRHALDQMAHNFFRVRPWFEPGPWGGQWIKQNLPELPQDAPNIAWSFELITPENGLIFESEGALLEVAFDFLMFQNSKAILGQAEPRFGYEFPIRFDWLDTIDGGNLSVQCHPRPEYIQQNFGENFTQDETYYILEAKPTATVYLGFQESVDPQEFRQKLEESFRTNAPVDIEHYIQRHPAQKHDLFLIPNGTVHCSGEGSVVLEISATPYIFTFKMYDWLRLDLDGKPRPLNIERAFENLYFERQGSRVKDELISKPYVLEQAQNWKIIHLPTHPEHFYDVHRLEFDHEISISTQGQCHVLALVEGSKITLETQGGLRQTFNYAETFVVPAAAGSYRLINLGNQTAKVIKSFVKPGAVGGVA